MVHEPFFAKTTTPHSFGWVKAVQVPVHVALALATSVIVVSGGADAVHVPTLPVLQLKGPQLTLPVPTMLSEIVT
jgi:hypothetical protein